MSKIAGRVSQLEISTDGGSNWNPLGGMEDLNCSLERQMIKTTSHGDSGETYIYGRLSGTMDGSGLWDEADAGQLAAMDAISAASTFLVRFYLQQGTGKKKVQATALCNTWKPSGPNDDAAKLSVSFQLSGDIDIDDQ